jgi:hypothetical protein
VRQLNERALAATRNAGQTAIQAYQSMLQSMLALEQKLPGGNQLDTLKMLLRVQAEFAQDIGKAYVSATRDLFRSR